MAVYQAPDIKDRIAVGDDLYQIADSGGKKKLTPDPTEVTEAGTPINKALLQPLVDAVARIDTAAVPYVQYWWRRRPVSGGYVETRQRVTSTHYDHTNSQTDEHLYYLNVRRDTKDSGDEEWYYQYATLKYASSVSINQSTGAVSLVNPQTFTFTNDVSVSSSSVYGRFQGKYVQGFLAEGDTVFYIPINATMGVHSWSYGSGGTNLADEYGYEFTLETADARRPWWVNSVKTSSFGSWEPISSDADDTYPKSGTSGGYDWKYLGTISESILTPTESAFDGIASIPVTAASWTASGSTYTFSATIPCKRYFLAISGGVSSSAIGIVDNGKFTGLYYYRKDLSSSQQTYVTVGATSMSSYGVSITSTGLSFSQSSTDAFTIGYMSLDK